jgi:hypothetical protein
MPTNGLLKARPHTAIDFGNKPKVVLPVLSFLYENPG